MKHSSQFKKSRRNFLRNSVCVTAGFLSLRHFAVPSLRAQSYLNEVRGYGPLLVDPHHIIDLPKGFQYTVLSRTGDIMDDGFRIPGAPDGMAAFPGPGKKTIIVRNHELNGDGTFEGPFGIENELFDDIDKSKVYDPGIGERPAIGGTTTLHYNHKKQKVERQFLSLVGTVRNCAGGPTPWGTWITCEETIFRAGDRFYSKDHGFNFEVAPTLKKQLADPIALKEMGRFTHEAVAVDPKSGIVFQTEDVDDGLIYRYVPKEYGKLIKGGRLQALAVRGEKSLDTRNWPTIDSPPFPIGVPMEVEWIDLENVLSPENDLRLQGFDKGATRFANAEGMWYGKGEIYFACSNGGKKLSGQIWRYIPSPYEGSENENKQPGRIELYLEPNDTHLLEYCENLTVAQDHAAQDILESQGAGHKPIGGVGDHLF